MRRGTLITIVLLFVVLIAAAIYQGIIANGPRRFPGPGFTSTAPASITPSTP